MATLKNFICLLTAALCLAATLALPDPAGVGGEAMAASAYSPRNSGTEPPDSPRHIDALPGRSAGRTPEGGMGYTDAYGNTIENREPEEKTVSRRAGSARRERSRHERPLPNPDNQAPAWSFK